MPDIGSSAKGELHAELSGDGKTITLAGTEDDFPGSGMVLRVTDHWERQEFPATNTWNYVAVGTVFVQSVVFDEIPIAGTGFTFKTKPAITEGRAVVDMGPGAAPAVIQFLRMQAAAGEG